MRTVLYLPFGAQPAVHRGTDSVEGQWSATTDDMNCIMGSQEVKESACLPALPGRLKISTTTTYTLPVRTHIEAGVVIYKTAEQPTRFRACAQIPGYTPLVGPNQDTTDQVQRKWETFVQFD